MNSKGLLISLTMLFYFGSTNGQTEVDVEQFIESTVENYVEDFDYSAIVERLNFYRRNPLDINQTSKEQLQELHLLSPLQINSLLNHKNMNRAFVDILELQSVEGFDPETIRRLIPFVRVGEANLLNGRLMQRVLGNGKHDILFRYGRFIQTQQGFTSNMSKTKYLGCPNRLLVRYKFDSGNKIFASLNMEKDAGESFFSDNNQIGFDYYSASIMVKEWGKISKLIVGDYGLQFGEGLALWSGLSFGKGADITTIAKQDIGIKPHTSVNEHSFFRGIVASVDYKSFRFTPFLSYKKLDASVNDGKITSLFTSGLHRTSSEVNYKNTVTQSLFGAHIQYNKKLLTVGLTTYQSRYDYPFDPGKYLYNRFDFAGSRLTNISLNYNYSLKNNYFFGEIAHSLGSGYAYLNGLISSLSPQVSVSILHRSYQKNYHSFYNQAIAEATHAVNEKGLYTGLLIKPHSKWEWFSYVDIFKFPWLKFGVDAPSKGYELFSQLIYQKNKKLKFIFRYKLKLKEQNDKIKNSINKLESVERQNYRAEVNWKVSNSFLFRYRIELLQCQKGKHIVNWGRLVYQDIVYNQVQSKLAGSLRIALFNIPKVDSRIYAYENDVLYSYTIYPYQNRGLRWYFNSRYTIQKGLDLWLKYSTSIYLDQEKIGSGLDQINGRMRSEIRLQVRYLF